VTDEASPADPGRLDLTGTRAAGLARLQAMLPRLGRHYAANGHVDHGPEARGNVPALTPWLRSRLVTPAEALAAVEGEHGGASRAFAADLSARDDRRAWLDARPELWRRQRLRVQALFRAMEKSASLLAAYDDAVEGRTGLDAFDAWSRELNEIGWLHPLSRRAYASLWIFSLRLPWELGADLFGRLLVDAEPAEDLLLWREVAGLQPGRPAFIVTVGEIRALTAGRFSPRLKLVDEHAAPLARDAVPSPTPPAERAAAGEGRTGLLLTEEDLSVVEWAGPPPAAVATLSAVDLRSPWPTGDRARAFAEAALADAAARAEAAFGAPVTALDSADWARSLVEWARDNQLTQIATRPTHVGPVAERLAAAERKLTPLGVTLAR
jgi:deoxyribodipyrimidine photo-lyase